MGKSDYDPASPLAYKKGKNSENKPGHKAFVNYSLPEWVLHPLLPKPTKAAILFPGEQNHAVGMCKDVKTMPAVQEMMDKATEIFGWNVEDMMTNGPLSKMAQTGYNQCLMYVANCAAFELLKEKQPDIAAHPQAVAGYSVGEWSALYAAGVITYVQGLRIVKARAQAIQEFADAVDTESMLIDGYSEDKVARVVRTAEKLDRGEGNDNAEVYIARRPWPDGYICSGRKSTVNKLKDATKGELEKPRDMKILDNKQPAIHTPMAKEAEEKLEETLNELIPAMNPPTCELYLNGLGWRIPPGTTPFEFADVMRSQLTSTLVWDASIVQMLRWGVSKIIECGPGKSIKFMLNNYEIMQESPFEIKKPFDFASNITV